MRYVPVLAAVLGMALGIAALASRAQDQDQEEKPVVPHGQDRPPGDPLSPEEAVRKMTVPEGFTVELVASEPEIVNPVAMTFDEKGRIWITESLEYPRRSAGPGRDRVKVLEDTDGDGKADKVTTFTEGLNIPSGIAVGYGGVWVANAPDILFYPDADGDLTPDGPPEVVVSGFGRDDTHELPNSLTWGPDGWLYGWNGVFNPSKIEHRGQTFAFTCAIFRIHPKTRDFELFCEGTSNPWGIAIDPEGSLFASACVIDHLWHLVETGYYHRQGGPYPPFTWKIESIVDHLHQKRAYCGIHYFDSDAYPPEYRDKLYMGNIHGNCVNVDRLTREGSTYKGHAEPDFLSANDAWFMPVVQKTGPDGCLYVLDWYDRYHCYQDANRDPEGIDRSKGRLYRVRYQDTPRAPRFDMASESDDQLIERLHAENDYIRSTAQRVLTERAAAATRPKLEALVFDASAPRKTRMHALWVLVSIGSLETGFHEKLLTHEDAGFRAWGVRAAGNMGEVEPTLREQVVALVGDDSRDVQLQVVIAAGKVKGIDPLSLYVEALSNCGDDEVIPRVVWQNLHPKLEDRADEFLALLRAGDLDESPNLAALIPRVLERILGRSHPNLAPVADLFHYLIDQAQTDAARRCLTMLAEQVQTGELAGERLAALRERMQGDLLAILAGSTEGPIYVEAALLAASWNDSKGLEAVRPFLTAPNLEESQRLRALESLVAANDSEPILKAARRILKDSEAGSEEFRSRTLATLGRLDDPEVAAVVLEAYPELEPAQRPRAIELLTQRDSWSKALLEAIGHETLSASDLNVNQIRKLQQSKDEDLAKMVRQTWGVVREGRDPAREQVIERMREHLRETTGNPVAGLEVFNRVCAQCHKIYGQGEEVGPDITGNGRGSYEQLLSNVFDPSLVIGSAYQATTVATADGRILTGLLAEDSPRRVVLKVEGGKQEIIPREDVEEMKVAEVSLMPENLEEQLNPQEIADLFSYIVLDAPPEDPRARPIPGAEELPSVNAAGN
ncbi:HEAT repeat domain-containing protein [soil metagenome]